MNGPIEEFEHNGFFVKIFPDEDAGSPREEYDNAARLVCFHKRYRLGDKHNYRFEDYSSWDELKAAIEENEGPIAVLKVLWLYDHSGITISTGNFDHIDSARWDSGIVGFAYLTEDTMRKEWGAEKDSEGVTPLQRAENCIEAEVETYDQYLTGQVYGYGIFAEEDDDFPDDLDACWGFYGLDECIAEAKSAADNLERPYVLGMEL